MIDSSGFREKDGKGCGEKSKELGKLGENVLQEEEEHGVTYKNGGEKNKYMKLFKGGC